MAPEAASTASQWFDGSIATVLVLGALFGFFRGAIRQLLWVCAVAIGGFVMYWSYRKFGEMGLQPGRTPLLIASAVAGFFAYWLVRKFGGIVLLWKSIELTGLGGLLAGLIPSGALVWLAGIGMRWLGAQDHLAELATSVKQDDPNLQTAASMWSQAKRALDGGVLGKFVGWFDPVAPNAMVNLAKLIVIANARTGNSLENDPAISKALHHPAVEKLRRKERVRLLVEHEDYAALLYDRDMNAALANAAFKKEVESLRFPATTR